MFQPDTSTAVSEEHPSNMWSTYFAFATCQPDESNEARDEQP